MHRFALFAEIDASGSARSVKHTGKDLISSRWMILCAALVVYMQAGFAMLEAGCCRTGFVSSVLEKNLSMESACAWCFTRVCTIASDVFQSVAGMRRVVPKCSAISAGKGGVSLLFSAKWFCRLDACIAAIGWWMLGWGFAYGAVPQYGFIGQEQCAEAVRERIGEGSYRAHFQLEAGLSSGVEWG